MKKPRKYTTWRAAQIAKIALLNSGFSSVRDSPERPFDLVAVSSRADGKVFLIEVKSSKHPSKSISDFVSKIKSRGVALKPMMVIAVNSDSDRGVFKIIEENKETPILPLERSQLEKAVDASKG